MKKGSTLLAFDFDGTLAPICQDPSAVRLPRAANALLREASQIRGLVLAIVSGRDVDDLAMRTPDASAYLMGSHGLEIRAPGGIHVRDAPALHDEIPAGLRAAAESAGIRFEEKKHAIAMHWRGVPAEDVESFVRRFRHWAGERSLDVIDGRCVVEARKHGGGKEEAVRWLASAIGAARVIYAGDDATDFGALRFAASTGCGIFMRNTERMPPPGVTVVGSFHELFRLIRAEVLI